MAAEKSTVVYDALASFELGQNSGISPYNLPKNQCAFSSNTTFRGHFATDRPPFQIKNLVFATAAVQQIIANGFFQGANYFTPDFGPQCIIAQISGHIIQFQYNAGTWNVSDISIPGDLNSATAPQAWLWQSEIWMIISDGSGLLPIFYDGTACRRSYGSSILEATTSAPFNPPAIGSTVTLSLTGNFTGSLSIPILLNNSIYLPVSAGGVASTNLMNISDTPGNVIPAGSQVLVIPQNAGNAGVGTLITFNADGTVANSFYTLTFDVNLPVIPIGTVLKFIGVNAISVQVAVSSAPTSPGIYRVAGNFAHGAPPFFNTQPPDNQLINYVTTQPVVTIAVVANDFTVPGVDTQVSAFTVSPYTGTSNQPVWINGNQYLISQSSSSGPSTNVTVLNLSDASTAQVAAGATLMTVPELPACRMGTYGMGRNWVSLLDGVSFIAGDIVGGSSGTPQYNGRDAIFRVTENTFLAGGGAFRVPGAGQQISAMLFVAILDASQGTGNLQIFTNSNVFGCNAPVDRTTWQNLTNPILVETLIGSGAASQDSVVRVNGDLIFRCPNPNSIRSLLLARLDFNQWGNTGNSREMSRVIDADNLALIYASSAIQFDNRLLMTASPIQSTNGVNFQSFIALNFDPNSSLSGKEPSIYDGQWTGLNTLKLVTGQFNGLQRAFALCLNSATSAIEIHEILTTGTAHLDDGINSIPWQFETPIIFNDSKIKPYFDLCKLTNGEIYVSDLVPGSAVKITVELRPDFSTTWYPWTTFPVPTPPGNPNSYSSRLGLGQPDSQNVNQVAGTQANVGRWFQLRITGVGHFVFQGAKLGASIMPEPIFAPSAANSSP